MPGAEVARALCACLVLGKELSPSLITADLCHPSVSINVMDRIVSDLEDHGQGAVAGALTAYMHPVRLNQPVTPHMSDYPASPKNPPKSQTTPEIIGHYA